VSSGLKIMIIRHGEKPEEKRQPPFGVNKNGEQNWDSLSVRGWQRAGALAALFTLLPGDPASPLATPQLIYASKPRSGAATPSADGGTSRGRSKRPRQTVSPLAARLGLMPNLDFGKGDEADLVRQVLTHTVPVLIAWSHEPICDLARQFTGAQPPQQPIPAQWPDDRFDVVWVLDPPPGDGRGWRLTQVPQRLLKGDSDQGIT